MNKARSGFLFAMPSFVSGAARLLDLYCLYDSYNSSSTEREADYKAMLSDWRIVGQDILCAMKQFERSLPPGSRAHDDDLCGASRQMSLFQ
ncbi:MAG: hypothetical protein HYR57_01780 [Candidatus Koribacter versatilis]|nr:hypothetical protein [Candidatus Koribacter versatilis]